MLLPVGGVGKELFVFVTWHDSCIGNEGFKFWLVADVEDVSCSEFITECFPECAQDSGVGTESRTGAFDEVIVGTTDLGLNGNGFFARLTRDWEVWVVECFVHDVTLQE